MGQFTIFHKQCFSIDKWGFIACSWSKGGLWALTLPQETEAEAKISLQKLRKIPIEVAVAAEAEVEEKITHWLKEYLQKGIRNDFPIDFDWTGFPLFYKTVLIEVAKIEAGKTKTYSELAAQVGNAKAVRAIGGALRRNPFPLMIPCHRILAQKGIGGFAGVENRVTLKHRLLQLEGIKL
ncbi:methylated-DNA--[protein]-cysteine S-methyltransferase [Heliorestis convoluta]|uniref:Methylated-DNA-[protein]-cysteine S-methyltransferase n=1 Tax=Heliorestis convoluta TaxID=356322 RepID=A0A5Q2MZ36_9FIRM|nr:MGMT family protein [Heliorestis convoluta]QGG46436.1 methylated-DNA-[protein]-cysteine S-methyltransferase [Heliorestis convoluta]